MLDWSYKEYLERSGKEDTRKSWIQWKIDICGMSEKEATIAGYDPEWGWEEGLGTK
jgi:hypothetical protein